MSRILPGEKIPENMFDTFDGRTWLSAHDEPPSFYLLVVYRGFHCSFCQKQLQEINERLAWFTDRNVEVIAVSTDSKERAVRAREEWGLNRLRLGYNLSVAAARELGLYISKAELGGEMRLFSEPGIFLIRPDKTLLSAWISSCAFARPDLGELVRGIDLMVEKRPPLRGAA